MSGNKPPLKREVARSAGGIVSMSMQGIQIYRRGEHRSPGIPGNTSTGKPCSPLQRRWEIMQDNPSVFSLRSIHLSTRHTLRAPFQGRHIHRPRWDAIGFPFPVHSGRCGHRPLQGQKCLKNAKRACRERLCPGRLFLLSGVVIQFHAGLSFSVILEQDGSEPVFSVRRTG